MTFEQGGPESAPWGNTLILTGFITSILVNALVMALIVLVKILKVFLEYKRLRPTSVERTLGSLSSTESLKSRHIRIRYDVVCHPRRDYHPD